MKFRTENKRGTRRLSKISDWIKRFILGNIGKKNSRMRALKFAVEVHEMYEISINPETARKVIRSKVYAQAFAFHIYFIISNWLKAPKLLSEVHEIYEISVCP